jgi:dTMP kinase
VTTTRGRFLVVEGGEASGKSTQVPLLVARLQALGRDVVATREPGGTSAGAALRALALDRGVAPEAEALVMAADRAQHVTELIRPALAAGRWVVSDRFTPSSLAYQGVGRGLGVAQIEDLSHWATGGLQPDLVVVVDVDDEVANARRDRPSDRMEEAGTAFHARVRQAYRDLAGERGWVLVDGDAPIAEVAERVWAVVAARLHP